MLGIGRHRNNFASPSGQLLVLGGLRRLAPLGGAFLAGDLKGHMGKPAVLRRTVPVLHPSGNRHHIAGVQRPGLLPPLLIPAPAIGAQQNLPAVCFTMVISPRQSMDRVTLTLPPPKMSRNSWAVTSLILPSRVKFQELVS